MHSSNLHTIAALLVALGLSACGGKASFDVSGNINRLDYTGLVLANGADTVAPAVGATSFTFPNRVDYGTSYNVTIKTQPQHMTCAVANATGSAGHTASIVVAVSCTINAYTISGTVQGLTGAGLELANGSDPVTALPAAGATTFAFTNKVEFGKPYGVGVLTQPSGQTCSVSANGTGAMGDANVADIAVSCTTP